MTMVLVHGGGFGASCWDPMLPFIDGPVVAVDLPGRGSRPGDLRTLTVDDSVAAVVSTIVDADLSDVLLVGHSMAGLTLPGVAASVPERLRRMVFVSCTVPAEGQSIVDTLPPDVQEVARASREGAPDSEPGMLDRDRAIAMFCNDMTPEQIELMFSMMVPEAPGVPFSPTRLHGIASSPVPRTWVRLLRDAIVPVERQDQFVDNLGGPDVVDVVDIDVAHMAMISAPKVLADVLNRL